MRHFSVWLSVVWTFCAGFWAVSLVLDNGSKLSIAILIVSIVLVLEIVNNEEKRRGD